jgi:hypothetical protein
VSFKAEENLIKQCQGAVNWGQDVEKEEDFLYPVGSRWDESQIERAVATLYTFWREKEREEKN